MSTNQVEPPRKWPVRKRQAAIFTYGITSCDQCGRIVHAGSWMLKHGDFGDLWCEKCWDKLEGRQ